MAVTAARIAISINANITAYSTAVGPSSFFRKATAFLRTNRPNMTPLRRRESACEGGCESLLRPKLSLADAEGVGPGWCIDLAGLPATRSRRNRRAVQGVSQIAIYAFFPRVRSLTED